MAGTSPAMTPLKPGPFLETRPKSDRNLPANRPGATSLVAVKSLARRDLSLRHGDCGKQILG
jgi:hypothetical protein